MLERLSVRIDWRELAEVVRRLPEYRNEGPGRRPWDAELMVRCVMLQTTSPWGGPFRGQISNCSGRFRQVMT